jgi:two-component system, NarL family, nitrate/nitrite response regulator NarL
MTAIRIAVIDDHPLFREGVTHALSDIGGFEVVGEGGSRDDALRIAEDQHPDVLLMDISMPGGGLNAIGPILERHPDQKIVMLTVSETSGDITKALNSGAKGYILKGVGSRMLADILRGIASGDSYLSPALSARLLSDLSVLTGSPAKSDPIADLTVRERDILNLVAGGLSNKQVALRLALEEKTVKHHMTRVLAKLNVRNRTQAAMMLRDRGYNPA